MERTTPRLQAEPISRDEIPESGSNEWRCFLAELVREAFSAQRCASTMGMRVLLNKPDNHVATMSSLSTAPRGSRLRNANWHTRASKHTPSSSGLTYEMFVDGLLKNHSANEQEYIEPCQSAECLEELEPGIAGIWHMKYATPFGTANRDFVELVVTLPLDAVRMPFSPPHEEQTLAQIEGRAATATPEARPPVLRSFLVVSVPVKSKPTPGYVRAYYASVESVTELPQENGENTLYWVCVWRTATWTTA